VLYANAQEGIVVRPSGKVTEVSTGLSFREGSVVSCELGAQMMLRIRCELRVPMVVTELGMVRDLIVPT